MHRGRNIPFSDISIGWCALNVHSCIDIAHLSMGLANGIHDLYRTTSVHTKTLAGPSINARCKMLKNLTLFKQKIEYSLTININVDIVF